MHVPCPLHAYTELFLQRIMCRVSALSIQGLMVEVQCSANAASRFFFNNCLKNGLLPLRLDEHSVAALIYQLHHADDPAQTQVDIDLESQTVRWQPPGGAAPAIHAFDIDPFWRECLMKGVDEVELTLSYLDQIGEFESRYLAEHPWINTR